MVEDLLDGADAVRGHDHLVSLLFQVVAEREADGILVLDDEDHGASQPFVSPAGTRGGCELLDRHAQLLEVQRLAQERVGALRRGCVASSVLVRRGR